MRAKTMFHFPASRSGKICLFLGILYALSLIPLLILAFYNHPVGDDFTYGMNGHIAWESTHSLSEVLKAAAATSHQSWYSYQGPFVSAFFMALQPAVISERLYPLTTFLMLGSMIVSVSIFFKVLLEDWYQIRRNYRRIITLVYLFLCTQLLPAASEAFYWYCGAVHYIFMHSCMLLLISSMLCLLRAERRSRKLLYLSVSCVLAFMTGGANFVTGLLTCLMFFVFAVFCVYYRKKAALWLLIPFAVNSCSFYLCLTAPGNLVREADSYGLMEPVPAILQSFRYCLKYIGEWNNPFFLLALVFLTPVLWNAASGIRAPFPLPGLVTAGSFCLLSAAFAPNAYALGTAVIFDRTLNIIMMAYYMLVILNLFYLAGWLHNALEASDHTSAALFSSFCQGLMNRYFRVFLISVSAWLVFMTGCTYHQDLASKSAAHDLARGYAQSYHNEVLHRISLLTMEGVTEVWVPNYSVRPHLLDLEDISTDPESWRNKATADWYDKEKVNLSIVYQN